MLIQIKRMKNLLNYSLKGYKLLNNGLKDQRLLK